MTNNFQGSEKPDLQHSSSASSTESAIVYHYLTFETPLPTPSSLQGNGLEGPDSPDLKDLICPLTWSESRKTLTTWLCCASTVLSAYSAGSYGPPATQMMDYFGVGQVAILVGITTFTLGFAIAPMVLAPFSELNGRKPVFVASGILFVVCQLSCGVTRSYPGMLVARFWAGVGSSTFSSMIGGILSDIYHQDGLLPASCLCTKMAELSQIEILQWLFSLEQCFSRLVLVLSAPDS